MIDESSMPPELSSQLAMESKDFMAKAKRRRPVGSNIFLIIFGLIWMSIIFPFVITIAGPLLSGGEAQITINGIETVGSLDNLRPIMSAIIMVGLFSIIGLITVLIGIAGFFLPGPWFVGTDKRLVKHQGGRTKSYNWSEFNGQSRLYGRGELKTLELKLNRVRRVKLEQFGGREVAIKNNKKNNSVYLVKIPHAETIEQQALKRIRENTAS